MESGERGFSEGRKLEPEVRRECRFPSNFAEISRQAFDFFLRT